MHDLGTLGGSNSTAARINNNGLVVGFSNLPGDTTAHAFLYSDGVMQDLGTLGGDHSVGLGINNKGQVTGQAGLAGDSASHAFLYSQGVMQGLGTLGGDYSWGEDINDRGHVVGYSYPVGNSPLDAQAFLYVDGDMQYLGSLGGSYSIAGAINNRGQVTGVSTLSGTDRPPANPGHAFLYSDGVMRDLGTLGPSDSSSYGSDVNENGEVVGVLESSEGALTQRAFLYSAGAMLDLNDLLDDSGAGWVLQQAAGINNAGQIVGTGTFNGQTRAFLLTPSPNGKRDRSCYGNTGHDQPPGHHRDRRDQRPHDASWVQPEHRSSRCDAW